MDINLLNWRHKRNLIANNRFYVVIGSVVLACTLLTASGNLIVMFYMMQSESNVALIDSELKEIEGDIQKIQSIQEQKDSLLKKRAIIEKLQKGRTFLVKAWEDIARVMPDGIVLDEMSSKKNEISLIGTAANNEQVATLMKNIQGLKWVDNAKLGEIKASRSTDGGANAGEANAGGATQAVSTGIDFRLQIFVKSDEGMGVDDEANRN